MSPAERKRREDGEAAAALAAVLRPFAYDQGRRTALWAMADGAVPDLNENPFPVGTSMFFGWKDAVLGR